MSKGSKSSSKGGGDKGVVDFSEVNALLDEILERPEVEKPDGFTIREYCEHERISHTTAMRRLNKLVEAGKLEVVKWKGTKTVTNVYILTNQ